MSFNELLELLASEEDIESIDSHREEMAELIPELRMMFGYDQQSKYHNFDLWQHTLHVLSAIPKGNNDKMLYFAALLHDIGKPLVQSRGKRKDDPYMHYIDHEKIGAELIENTILPRIYLKNEALPIFDQYRLIYYVRYHDRMLSQKLEQNEYLLEHVDKECFINLLQLMIADAKAHVITEQIMEKIAICQKMISMNS